MIKSLVLALSLFVATPVVAQRYCPNSERNQRAMQDFKRMSGYPHGRPGYVAVTRRSNGNWGVLRRNDLVWVRNFDAQRIERAHNRESRFRVEGRERDNRGPWWDPNNTGPRTQEIRNHTGTDRWAEGLYHRP
jgi:hypothetical protein